MILTNIDSAINKIDNIEQYHIEKVVLKSDDLNKKVLRVKTDHHNEYGIRLSDESSGLFNGAVFFLDANNLLVIGVHREEMIIIAPKTMDEMGEVAHMLGNTHKPIVVENEKIILEFDPTVIDLLSKKQIDYQVDKIELNKPLKHVDLSHVH